MCGIFGVVDRHHEPAWAAHQAGQLGDAVARRGPDGGDQVVAPPAVLGVRRLKVIDAAGSDQPARSEDGHVTAVLNGAIYNYRQLRRQLRGNHALRYEGDAEVLPHLYEEHGPEFVHRLRGSFAIALWDARRERLILARDRLGEKPLYYSHRDGVTLFSSLLAGVSRLAGPPVIGPTQLYEYLTWGFARSVDARGRIERVAPGTVMEFGDHDVETTTYWRARDAGFEGPAPSRPTSVTAAVRGALDDACVEQLPADGARWALLLSGGLDSSILAYQLSRRAPDTGELVTVRFEDCDDGEEDRNSAAAIAAQLSTRHREVTINQSQLADSLEMYIDVIDEPVGDAAGPVLHAVCNQLAGMQRIMMTGAGADEVFGGYPEHAIAAEASSPTRLLQALFRRAASLDSNTEPGALRRATPSATAAEIAHDQDDLREATPKERVRRVLALELEQRLPNGLLLMGDRLTMANGMEARSPYLDHRLVEAALRDPASPSCLRSVPKPALRAIGQPVLPSWLLTREKRGFPSPLAGSWFNSVTAPFAQVLRSDPPPWFDAAFDPSRLEALTRRADHGGDGARRALWRIVLLARWSEQTGATIDP